MFGKDYSDMDYVVRTLVGRGWRPEVALSNPRPYFNSLKSTLEKSLLSDIEASYRAAESRGDEEMKAMYNAIATRRAMAIEETLRKIESETVEAFEKLKKR